MADAVKTGERIAFYRDFWPFYLSEHRHPTSRRLHFVGTALTFVFFAAALFSREALWIVGAPVFGYFFAWTGHFFFEKNRPATFRYPVWSLISDYRMFFLWLGGKLDSEIGKYANDNGEPAHS